MSTRAFTSRIKRGMHRRYMGGCKGCRSSIVDIDVANLQENTKALMWDHRGIYASNVHRLCALKRFMDLSLKKKSREDDEEEEEEEDDDDW